MYTYILISVTFHFACDVVVVVVDRGEFLWVFWLELMRRRSAWASGRPSEPTAARPCPSHPLPTTPFPYGHYKGGNGGTGSLEGGAWRRVSWGIAGARWRAGALGRSRAGACRRRPSSPLGAE